MKKTLLSVLLIAFCSAGAWADVNVAAPFLQSGAGARSKGMGDSFLAVAEGPFGARYNPAGLAGVETASLGFQHDGVTDLLRQEILAGSFPLGPGGMFAGVEWIGYGALDQLDATGRLTGSTLSPTDLRLGLGYGLAVAPGLRAGATAGYYAENLGPQKLTGIVVDLGTAWDWSPEGSAALALKSLGSAPAGYSLPASLGAGCAYRLFNRALLLDAEVEVPLSPNTLNLGLGVEWQALNWLALRAGYKGPFNQSALETLVGGLGFSFWNFGLDAAFTSRGELGNQFIVSLTYTFAKAAAPKPQPTPAETMKYQGEDRKQAEFHFNAGKEYERYGQWIDAIVEYKAALSIIPDYPEAQNALAAARQQAAEAGQGNAPGVAPSASLQETIRKYYEQGLKAYKARDYSTAIRQLQLVLELTSQHRQATELLEKAQDALNQEIGTLRTQARKAKEKGDLASEVDAYRKMLSLDPENQKVKADLAAAEKKVPDQVDALYKQGVEYYASGNLRAALKSFQDVLALQPDHVKAKDAVANIKAKLVQTGQ